MINDKFNEPNHYKLGDINTMVFVKELLNNDNLSPILSFYKGNMIKYLIRAEKKNKIDDYMKALDYLKRFIEEYKNLKGEKI